MKLVECVYVYVVIKVYQYSKTSLIFKSGGNPDGEGFHWLFTKVNNHVGKPVSLWFGQMESKSQDW